VPSRPEVPNTRVLIGYASVYGSTKGIATKIGEHLVAEGLEVDVRPVDEIGSIESYGAAVLGSAIHNQRWLPLATDFMRSHAAALATLPVWLFSVCSVGETSSFLNERVARPMRRRRREPAIISEVRPSIDLRDHRYFAGAIEPSHWTAAGNLFLRLCGGTYGDHRDWADIDRWTAGIARSLQAASGSTPLG
jgi:menaquinone-dependent protoporphyrinogen oxidase